jgi:type IV pilus assembly protein PilE
MKRNIGFTVIELIVAVTIVCLLVAVAVASYQDHMTHKARNQARKALAESAEWLHIQHARSGTYLVKLPVTQTPGEGDALYQIKLAGAMVNATDPKAAFPATTAATYTLQAVPVEPDACGTLLLDSAGRTGVTGANALVADCWR